MIKVVDDLKLCFFENFVTKISNHPTNSSFKATADRREIFSRALLKALAIATLIACLTINSSKQKTKQHSPR